MDKYTARATASGAGRDGNVSSTEDGAAPLELKLSSPKALGGPGNGQNPEQLFAAGYAGKTTWPKVPCNISVCFCVKSTCLACFLGALQLTAGQAGKKDQIKGAKIHTSVSFVTS
jgi:hypothetical protein